MNIIYKIKTGSNAFFNKFEDFKPSDNDWIVFVDKLPNNKPSGRIKIKNDDLMLCQIGLPKKVYVDLALLNPLKIGKFLVPEFNEYINFTIDDLKVFEDSIDKLDDRHKYQKIIYDAYIENNSFTITDLLIEKAYQEYKKYREL